MRREWMRRVWGALSGRRTDDDLQRELAGHLAMAEEDLRRQGHTPAEAARLARAAAGGQTQAIEALREQRGLPWIASSWLDVRLGLRLLRKNWGLTLVGGMATTVAISIAAVVFSAFDMVLWSTLPLDEGDRIVAIQVWDRAEGRRRDTTWQDVERWRASLQSIDDVAAFQTMLRNVITADGAVDLVHVAQMSPSAFRVARVSPQIGRPIVDADAAAGADPVILIGHDVWQRRFGGAHDVLGRELRLGNDVHTIVGVMPEGYKFPLNFDYWVPLQPRAGGVVHNTGPEGAVFGRLADGASASGAHAEVAALGLLPSAAQDATTRDQIRARVVPYTFAFTGDLDPAEMSIAWSLSSLALILLLLPPCANIAILNYARTVTRQQEFAARHALGGSRARIIFQLFVEALVLTAAAGGAALLVLQVVSVVVTERLQTIPGGPPFWLAFGVSWRTVIFVGGLAVAAAAMSGLVPALQATRRLGRLGAGALAGRTSARLGPTWTALVIAQVGFSVAVLPIAAELTWGTIRTGVVGPGFPAEEFATARVTREGDPDLFAARTRALVERLRSEPGVAGVATAMRVPDEEPWVFVEIEGRDAPSDVLNGQLPGFLARFNQVDAAFFDLYQVPGLGGRRFGDREAAPGATAVVVNRNFAEMVAPGGNALGQRFRYVRSADEDSPYTPAKDRWFEVAGVVGNVPATTDARVAYHLAAPGELQPTLLQVRLRGTTTGITERLRATAAGVDPALHLDEIRTLDEIYRDHRFGDNLGALTIGAVTVSLLLLSAAGLYALMAFTVAQRRREIGIRSALGAQPGRLVAAVFRRAFWQVAAGAAVGIAAAFAVGRYIPIEQVGGLPIPGILPGAVAFMLLVGALASLGPARRGLRVDPTEALRGE